MVTTNRPTNIATLCSAWLLCSAIAACGGDPSPTGGAAPSNDLSVPTGDAATVIDTSTVVTSDGDGGVTSGVDGSLGSDDKDACHAFNMPSTAALFSSKKRVFAHYFYPFPLSADNDPATSDYYERNYLSPTGEANKWIDQGGYLRSRPLPVPVGASATYELDNMKKEVKMAIAAGITGFTVDALNTSEGQPGTQLANILLAAAAVDSRFKIVPMPDVGANASGIEAIIKSVANSPAAYRLDDGRLVATAFNAGTGSASFWTGVLNDLANEGVKVAFVPTFLGWESEAAAFAPITYGFADWGTVTPSSATAQQGDVAKAHGYDRIFMMPVGSQQYRPKDYLYWEAGNSAAFRDAWLSAINGDTDWVQVVTWSDFSESSQIEPYTDATLAGDIGTGYYDLNAYYAAWFLTGQAPEITHDVLYWFYRREPTSAPAPKQAKATTTAVGGGTGTNEIELVGFLASPGTLSITIDGKTVTKDAPAGVTSFTVPLAAGTPTFALTRGGNDVVSTKGGVPIVDSLSSGTLDLTYWSGSASTAGTCSLTVP